MGKPSEKELAVALKSAKLMRERDNDPFYLAKALLHCHYRAHFLEEVCACAEAYLHSGLADAEHRRLVQAIERLQREEDRSAAREPPTLGL